MARDKRRSISGEPVALFRVRWQFALTLSFLLTVRPACTFFSRHLPVLLKSAISLESTATEEKGEDGREGWLKSVDGVGSEEGKGCRGAKEAFRPSVELPR